MISYFEYPVTMTPTLRKLLYFLFKLPSMKPENTSANPQTRPLKRNFVMMRVHVGEGGNVKDATIRMSCGNPAIDKMALADIRGKIFAQPRVGHKAVAQWHNMRWQVPENLRNSSQS